MQIGIDFDNTIVSYDTLFHKVCVEQNLIPPAVPPHKSQVRDYLRGIGREAAWTEIQGLVYGARMAEAEFYPGVREAFLALRERAVPVFIISHKTRHPFLGPQYDLHAAARDWLEKKGFFDPRQLGLPRENVFFELTKEAKMQRIASTGVTHFIDDLPEILNAPAFPSGVKRILFDPNDSFEEEKNLLRVRSWSGIMELLS
jgi:hypothetical protein